MIRKIYREITKHKWEIGFVETSLDEIFNGNPLSICWIKHNYRDRWFADPFILNANNHEIILLAEEFCFKVGRGRIAKLVVDRNTCELKSMKIILDLPTHLSFPAIYRKNDMIYIYPENHDTGKLTMYLYDDYSETCKDVKVLCHEPLTDAVYTHFFGEKMIFSTKIPTQNRNELGIYIYNSDKSVYELKSIYHFNENIARMAGDFFKYNNEIYRPAQECNETYGHAISIQKVSYCHSKFEFREKVRLLSPNSILNLGIHTFNIYGDLIVVDAKGYIRPRISKLLSSVKKFFDENLISCR